MRYRQLAPDLQVSEVGFGNWTCTTGWWGEYTEAEAIALHRVAFDAGITFFDTADAYAEGYGEQVLGKALADVRDQVVIATKFGYDLAATDTRRGQQERPHRTDVVSVRKALDDSRARLGVDTIDLWQLHNPRMGHLDDDELFAFLDEAVADGKIRAYGVALGPKIGWLDEGLHAMRTRGLPALQMIYNLLEQDPGRELLAAGHHTGTKMVVRVPHSSGMLEGNLTADTVFPANDHRRHRPRSWLLEGVAKVANLDFLRRDMTLGQAALRWILADDGVATTLPNIYGADQIDEFAADVRDLTAEELAAVDELYARNFDVEPESDRTTKVNA
ncbi:MAG: aldo/keto reductase [Euzebyaceae bacterium]|jgi:aryl-alcohol dehydrogenase-like predicted oxidoreductase|nr:aldo/keto reductase [Euzebyaceae bacterium]